MKIYIETDMTEKPKGCYMYESKMCPMSMGSVCAPGDGYIGNQEVNTRPQWCPLRTETEIADKAKEDNNAKQF